MGHKARQNSLYQAVYFIDAVKRYHISVGRAEEQYGIPA
jgi:hypothetical protein